MAIIEIIETRANIVEHSYTRVFLVRNGEGNGNNTHEKAYLACTDDGVPSENEAHPQDASSLVSSIEAEPFDTNEDGLWRVTVEYTVPDDDAGETTGGGFPTPSDPTVDPWDRPETLSVTPGLLSREAQINYIDGNDSKKKIENTAGQKFSIGYKVKDPMIKVTATKSYTSFNMDGEASLVGKINAGPITFDGNSFAAKQCLYDSFSASQQSWTDGDGNETIYWTVSRNYLIRDTWELEILNDGTIEVDTVVDDVKTVKVIRDENRNVWTKRMPLTLAGKAFRDPTTNKLIQSPPTSSLVYIKVQPYKTGNIR